MRKVLFTFDLDGVLMVNPFARGVFPEVQRRLAPFVERNISEEEAASYVQRKVLELAAAFTRRGEWHASYDWDRIVNAVARDLGAEEQFDVAAIVRSYCRPGYIDKYDDVTNTLTWLKQHEIRLAWVSNGYSIYQQPVLDALRIADFFDDRVAPDLVGSVKPDPRIFWHVRPANASVRVHIGDTLIHDVAGAKQAGFTAVWIDRSLPEPLRALPIAARGEAFELDAYLKTRVEREFCWEAYNLEIPSDVRPDYIVYTLHELRGVLADLDPTHKAVG